MSLCQLDNKMKQTLRDKLLDIHLKSEEIIETINNEKSCLLCEVSTIKDMALNLNAVASLYHFQSSLLPNVKGMTEISSALTNLSHKNHGALIILEQNDSLEEYVDACLATGALIGAQVSAPLLETIFYPGTPLHDGAVIVRNGEIVSAGCIIPLSAKKYTKEGRKIGTRHRAAIGISERSDAVGIVVSEETGTVSIAQGGNLYPIELNMCKLGGELHPPNFKPSTAESHLQAFFNRESNQTK